MKPLRAALLIFAFAMLLAPAGALAAPPSNDNFADRSLLEPSLPIAVPASNVEATKEEGEFIPGLSPAGHSVWFQWEADEDGWVTIGVCDSEFPAILGIFTGTELKALTPVISGNSNEGPDCPFSQSQYTFKAVSGTDYVIAVDGNNFTGPEPVPVETEGEFLLQIEKTQPPANDYFIDAEPLIGQIGEEPGGNRFYSASTRGHNWMATTEVGEPSYGVGAGASVWYEWTVPVEGTYFIGPCCGPQLEWALYSGDALADLTQIFRGSGSTQLALAPGANLKIAVFGPPDAETEEPAMGSFSFLISANLPPLPKPPSGGGGTTVTPPPPPVVVPETKVVSRTLKHRIGLAKFRFTSTVAGSSFQCKLDNGPFKPCKSPKTYKRLKPGRHTFKVKAISPTGVADPSAWVGRFLIAEPQR